MKVLSKKISPGEGNSRGILGAFYKKGKRSVQYLYCSVPEREVNELGWAVHDGLLFGVEDGSYFIYKTTDIATGYMLSRRGRSRRLSVIIRIVGINFQDEYIKFTGAIEKGMVKVFLLGGVNDSQIRPGNAQIL